eukprot:COSAG04_NODE_2298_length_4363_cov_6.625820_5_plen_105_part_00
MALHEELVAHEEEDILPSGWDDTLLQTSLGGLNIKAPKRGDDSGGYQESSAAGGTSLAVQGRRSRTTGAKVWQPCQVGTAKYVEEGAKELRAQKVQSLCCSQGS